MNNLDPSGNTTLADVMIRTFVFGINAAAMYFDGKAYLQSLRDNDTWGSVLNGLLLDLDAIGVLGSLTTPGGSLGVVALGLGLESRGALLAWKVLTVATDDIILWGRIWATTGGSYSVYNGMRGGDFSPEGSAINDIPANETSHDVGVQQGESSWKLNWD